MRIARPTPKDIEQLREFFIELDELLVNCEKDKTDIGEWLQENYQKRCGRHWHRILFVYEMLVDNACDLQKTYLAWKPDIQDAIAAANSRCGASPATEQKQFDESKAA